MNPLEISYILRLIFAFLGDRDRNNIYRTCRIFRENYRWVYPRESLRNLLIHKNYKLANEMYDFVGQYLDPCDGRLCVAASDYNFFKIVNNALDHDFDPSYDDCAVLYGIIKHGNLGVLERILQDPRINFTSAFVNLFSLASKYGHLSIVDRLLQDGRFEPSKYKNQAIRWASANGHLAVVDRLLKDPIVSS